MNGTIGINSGWVSLWDDMVGMGTFPPSMSKSIRSITSSGGACAGFVDSLEPKGCPAKSDIMWSDSGTVSLVVVTLSIGQAYLQGGDLDLDSDSGLGHKGWCCQLCSRSSALLS
jgi:hypothetical protein